MSRAPNLGAPQRVSPHVVPKAKSSANSGEEDPTTLEPQWEEEASTTVEQGEVAEKIRSLQNEAARAAAGRTNTNVTNTAANQPDELTVDDGRANPNAALPIQANAARLVITQGNESGQELEIKPGKTYTVGRGIDNDVVLTDIAVSRKHFDLRNADGAWVLVDHGSGNGTVVNGNVEDNPFVLASGDVIEIGNTSFRFDQQNGAPRGQSFDAGDDDDELSTVAGKPLRTEPQVDHPPPVRPSPVAVAAPGYAPQPSHQRPKTQPPPGSGAPLPTSRTRAPSIAQPLYPAALPLLPTPNPANLPSLQNFAPAAAPLQAPLAAGNRVPMLAPQAPTMLGDQLQPPRGMLPTTIPGQAPPTGSKPMYYPLASDMSSQGVGSYPHMVVMPHQPHRGDGSTTHVPPMPYSNGLPAAQPARYVQPQLTTRAKYIVGGALLTMFAAFATVAVLRSGGKAKSAGAAPAPGKPHFEPITTTATPGSNAPKQEPIQPQATKVEPVPPVSRPEPSKVGTAEPRPEQAKLEPGKTLVVEPPKQLTKVEPEPPKPEPPKPIAKTEKIEKVEKVEPPKPIAKTEKVEKVEPPKPIAKTEKVEKVEKVEPPKQITKAEKVAGAEKTEKLKRNTGTTSEPKPKRVAAAVDTDDIKNRADDLYKNKKFNEAASLLYSSAKSLPEEDAKPIRYTASAYDKLARAYSSGTQPATKPIEAYQQLKAAEGYDRAVGGAFIKEIEGKLAAIAPKAAIGFMAAHDYEAAHVAVATAETLGTANETTKIVKQTLDSRASELYQQAKDDPTGDGAKDKLHKILKMVDPKSIWYGKAQKLLGAG